MPIYEYRCEKDGHTFEVMQRFSDDPVESCEVCGAPVQRVFHPVAVHFKGKGFYATDYGSRNRARELKESAEGSKSGSDSSSSGDSSSGSDAGSKESKSSDTKSSDSKGSKSESSKAAA